MGHMKYIHMLQRQDRIQELERAYKDALDKGAETFTFDEAHMYTEYAKHILEYVSKYPLRIEDPEP